MASSDQAPAATQKVNSILCTNCEGNGAVSCSQCKGEGLNSQDHLGGRFKAGTICWFCRLYLFVMDSEIQPRVVRYDSDLQTIAQLLEEWKRASILLEHVEWLIVSTQLADKSTANVDRDVDTPGLHAAWESLCLSSVDRLTTKNIEELAIAYNVLQGKWLIFVNQDKVDEEWAKVAVGVIKGGLALDAKVSTLHVKPKKNGQPKEEKIPLGKHVICVWSKDFTNIIDVFALRGRLRDLGFSNGLYYKPGAYSVCGIYQGNELGLPAHKFWA